MNVYDVKYLSVNHPDVQNLRLEDGDLLFNRTNSAELVGKSAVYRKEYGAAIFASYLIRCRLVPGVNPDWLCTVINSPSGRCYIKAVMTQQVGQANVNGTKLAGMPIPLPPEHEQNRILEHISEQQTSARRLDNAAAASEQYNEKLQRSILTEAFAGRLVPQDPNDEPASVLLEQIRANRAATPKAKQTRRSTKKIEEASPAQETLL